MLRSKLHCQKGFHLNSFSYEILTWSVGATGGAQEGLSGEPRPSEEGTPLNVSNTFV